MTADIVKGFFSRLSRAVLALGMLAGMSWACAPEAHASERVPVVSGRDIEVRLGEMASFSIVADEFRIKGDMEGNIAVNELSGHGEMGITNNVVRLAEAMEVRVRAEGGSGRVLTAALVKRGQDVPSATCELAFDDDGRAEATLLVRKPEGFTIDDAYALRVFDEAGKPLDEDCFEIGDPLGYPSDAIMATASMNYVKRMDVSSMVNGKRAENDRVVTVETDHDGARLDLMTVTEDEFDEMVDVGAWLDEAAELSCDLAMSVSTDELDVVEVRSDELTANNRMEIASEPGRATVLNVRIPFGRDRVGIDSDTLKVGGFHLARRSDNGFWDIDAGGVLWNFVYEDGTPYDGTVKAECSMSGAFLAPRAAFDTGFSSSKSVIAESVVQGDGEVHKVTFGQGRTAAAEFSLRLQDDSFEIEDEDVPLAPAPVDPGEDEDDLVDIEDPDVPLTPGPEIAGGEEGADDLVDIEEPDVPLAPSPGIDEGDGEDDGLVEIPDEEVPLAPPPSMDDERLDDAAGDPDEVEKDEVGSEGKDCVEEERDDGEGLEGAIDGPPFSGRIEPEDGIEPSVRGTVGSDGTVLAESGPADFAKVLRTGDGNMVGPLLGASAGCAIIGLALALARARKRTGWVERVRGAHASRTR